MSLLHRSTDTRTDKPVTDVMASKASSTSTMDTSGRDGDVHSQEAQSHYRRHGAPVGHMTGAFLALLLAAWAGIIAYVGPTFGFSADGSSSWTWNELHTFGSLVPGAVGVLASLLILMSARQRHGLMSSVALGTWGFVLFVCGAWLAVTPIVWPVIVGTYFHAASPSMTLAYWMGYSSGPGVLLAGFGAFTMGRTRRPAA
jgi:hypothetical protein